MRDDTAATLSWLGTGDYIGTGVNVTSGGANDVFSFRVMYNHPTGEAPTGIFLAFDGVAERHELNLLRPDGGSGRGDEYGLAIRGRQIGPAATYRYRFEADLTTGRAAGDPTQYDNARTVTVN
ncbi:MAG TPA: hypothetical protein QGH10_05230 [Armatimonadota bacterium]|nr:hypothetical protein [Armatimonadota bacterium]